MKNNGAWGRWLSGSVLVGAMLGCRADTIFLTDGREINGTITSEDQQTIVIKTTRGVSRSIRRAEIDTVVRDKAKAVVKDEPKSVVGPPPPIGGPAGTKPVAPQTGVVPAAAPLTGATVKLPPIPNTAASVNPATPDAASDNATSPKIVAVPSALTNPKPGTATGPIPIGGFPENSKRMTARKEALFADAMDAIKAGARNLEDASREAAISDIRALGSDAIPYLWAGVQSENVDVRTVSMKLIGQLSGRTCIKRVLETFYMTMPEASAAAIWNVPFVDETIKTMTSITGQSFVNVEARRVGVQDGLKKYIEWYKTNFKALPKQIGEPELDANDPGFDTKLATLRELKLVKREWPRVETVLPADLVAGPNKTAPEKPAEPIANDVERKGDKKFGNSIPTVADEGSALKRPNDKPTTAATDENPLQRAVDRRSNENPSSVQNQRRDPRDEVPSQKPGLDADPLQRPVDARKQQQ